MAASVPARHLPARPRYADDERPRPVARRAPRPRPRSVARAGLGRALVIFVICLTVLAAGRVALSFAVVQKTLQTDAIARQERQVTAENARLAQDLAQLSSAVHVRYVAERELGLVDTDHWTTIKAPRWHGAKAGSVR